LDWKGRFAIFQGCHWPTKLIDPNLELWDTDVVNVAKGHDFDGTQKSVNRIKATTTTSSGKRGNREQLFIFVWLWAFTYSF
jgi:hypothetical protein